MEDSDERPWEEAGQLRRDFEPHRGPNLQLLGLASLVCGALGCLCIPALIGLPLGVVIALMAHRDVNQMKAGLMDAEGMKQTLKAQTYGALGALLSVFCSAFPLGLFVQRLL